jgi:hypothetical protein
MSNGLSKEAMFPYPALKAGLLVVERVKRSD